MCIVIYDQQCGQHFNFIFKMESFQSKMTQMFGGFVQNFFDKMYNSITELCYGCEIGKFFLFF